MDPLVRLLIHGAAADSFHDFKGKAFNQLRDPSNPGLYHVITGIPETQSIPKGKPFGTSVSNDMDILHDEDELLGEMFAGFTNMGDFITRLRSFCVAPTPCREVSQKIQTLVGPVEYTIKLLKIKLYFFWPTALFFH